MIAPAQPHQPRATGVRACTYLVQQRPGNRAIEPPRQTHA